jgi:DNA-binding transcriptional ArsR family regulator
MAARPKSRTTTPERSRERGTSAPSRPAVRTFGAAGTDFVVEFDVRPAYDFLFSLSADAGSTDDLPAADRRWLADALASLPEDVSASVGRLFANEICAHLAVILVDRPEVRTADQLVEALEAIRPDDMVRLVYSWAFREPELAGALDRYLAGTGSLEEIEAQLPEHKRDYHRPVLQDREKTYRDSLVVLRAWADVFRTIEPRVTAILERDHDLRAGERATLSGPDLIERATGGIRWLPEAGVKRVILAPSYFTRPYNFLFEGEGWRFFGYPVSDDALDADDPLAPNPGVMRLHRALGDETRLRILKLLSRRDLYLTEIAQQLDLSKPTIKHHLAQLRAAGLVTITESGTVVYYTLRRQRLDDASTEIKRYLLD